MQPTAAGAGQNAAGLVIPVGDSDAAVQIGTGEFQARSDSCTRSFRKRKPCAVPCQ